MTPLEEGNIATFYRLPNLFQTLLILSFRFLYELCTVTPFVIGMSPISAKKFFLLNASGALVRAAAFGSSGYIFGQALKILIGKIEHYELLAFGLIARLGLLIWTVHFIL
jgi:membrane protein DedA with SNARE-associated domain